MKRIGIAGAGAIASGMAKRFLQHGYHVSVWNRTRERLAPLLKAGAVAAHSPKELAAHSDIVIECVADDEASRHVWLGHDGIIASGNMAATYIASSTLSVAWVDELAERCAHARLPFFDMPVTGGRDGAESGDLRLLAGGDEHVINNVREVLLTVGREVYRFGEVGTGTRFKLMLNTLSALHIQTAAAAAAIASKSGVDYDMFFHAIFEGEMAPASPAVRMFARDKNAPHRQVNVPLRMLEKDLRYAQAMVNSYHSHFPQLDMVQHEFQQAMHHGLADADITKIAELYWRPKEPPHDNH